MNHYSHYVLTNNSVYVFDVIRSCCEFVILQYFMSHLFAQFVKLLMFLVGFELTTAGSFSANRLQHFTTVPQKTTDINCYRKFIFKLTFIFLNSEHNCVEFNNTLHYMNPDIVHIVIAY